MEYVSTPEEYKEQFESKVKEYIETQHGTLEEYIDEQLTQLDREIQQLESHTDPEYMDPGLYVRAQNFGYLKYINANKRKIDFLKEYSLTQYVPSSVSDDEVLPNHFNGSLKMTPTEAVELIRAMEKAGCLNVQLSTMYELFGRLIGKRFNGNKISHKIKERSTPYFIQELGKGWDSFTIS